MTPAERAACLRAAAVAGSGYAETEFAALAAQVQRLYLQDATKEITAFHRAAAALPNPEKLVAREATVAMCKASESWWRAPAQVDDPNDDFGAMWTAAHDAAAKWEEG